MVSRRHVFPAVLALVLGVLVPGGCSDPGIVTRPPEYTIGPRAIVVIPFKDQMHSYYESQDGVDLAMAVVGEMRKRGAATNIKSADQVRALFPNQDLDTVGWGQIGRKLGTDLILTGNLQRFTLRDPGHILLRRGTCILNYFVYDVGTNTVAYAEQGLSTYIPEFGPPIADSDMSEEELRRRVIATTALKLVKKFYEYEERIRPTLPRH
ncbi:MAG TPA: hypothetical protein VMZ92_08435 [Planctomycetota bacterium]|nr:hypothetical protein [Planctomycetota bacterium]